MTLTLAADRFWAKVDRSGECWTWTAGKTRGGYGIVWMDGRLVKAHRWSLEQVNGPIPPDMFVLHRCDNPPCVRPDHLFVGTNADNMADMVRKGRSGRRTHCTFGHPLSGWNLYEPPSGRFCRKCLIRRGANYRRRRRRAPEPEQESLAHALGAPEAD